MDEDARRGLCMAGRIWGVQRECVDGAGCAAVYRESGGASSADGFWRGVDCVVEETWRGIRSTICVWLIWVCRTYGAQDIVPGFLFSRPLRTGLNCFAPTALVA